MRPETIEIIRKKLLDGMKTAMNELLRNIEASGVDGVSPGVEKKIMEYREAYKAWEDFDEWANAEEDRRNDGD